MAEPGGGVASGPPDCGTTIRIRAGVAADASRAMLTGAIRRRGPRWLGDSTSTTKPSTVVTPRAAGTMGVATASLCSLATRNPKATPGRYTPGARPPGGRYPGRRPQAALNRIADVRAHRRPRKAGRDPHSPLAYGNDAHWHRAHGFVQLALCTPLWRRLSHQGRRHRSRTLH